MSLTLGECFPFSCGDIVREVDGRHHGRVEAVVFNQVKVCWHDTRWITWFPDPRGLEKVPRWEVGC